MVEIYAAIVASVIAIGATVGGAVIKTGKDSRECIIRLESTLKAQEQVMSGIHYELKTIHQEVKEGHKDLSMRIDVNSKELNEHNSRIAVVETQCVRHGV